MNQVPFSWPQLLIILVGIASPFLTHLVTTEKFPEQARRLITYAISAIAAALIQVAYDPSKPVKVYFGAVFYAWAGLVVAHFTLLTQQVTKATPNTGIGAKTYDVITTSDGGKVKVTESPEDAHPKDPPKSPGKATRPRQSKLKPPRTR